MDGMIKTATSNNVIYCDVTINPPLCTIVTSGCGGPRTHEPLFTRFSRYSPDLLVNIACCFLQEVAFSANGIAYNNRLYKKTLMLPSNVAREKYKGKHNFVLLRGVRHCLSTPWTVSEWWGTVRQPHGRWVSGEALFVHPMDGEWVVRHCSSTPWTVSDRLFFKIVDTIERNNDCKKMKYLLVEIFSWNTYWGCCCSC